MMRIVIQGLDLLKKINFNFNFKFKLNNVHLIINGKITVFKNNDY